MMNGRKHILFLKLGAENSCVFMQVPIRAWAGQE